MADHFHFDLDAAERSMQAGYEEMNAKALANCTEDRNREFLKMQIGLQRAQIAFALWHLRQMNDEAEIELTVQALGHAIGTVVWTFATNTDEDAPLGVVEDVFNVALETVQTHAEGAGSGSTLSKTTLYPMAGGRA
jgi:hypothetical protein